jgi:hypothetical protein
LLQSAVNKRYALKKSDTSWVSLFKVQGQWYTVAIDFAAATAVVLRGDRSADFVQASDGWQIYDKRVISDGQHRFQLDETAG